MNKLSKLFDSLSLKDIELIKKDLEAGNIHKIIEKKLTKAKQSRLALCPVCNTPIKEGEGLHLQFGPPDLRKKATFDGVDCLRYFIDNYLQKKR